MTDSFYYSRFPSEIEDRLDYNYNDPKYDVINSLLSNAKYPIVTLGDQKYLKSITKGKTPRGLRYVDEGIPFIGGTQIISGSVNIDDAPKIPVKIHKTKLLGSQLKKGNVLLTMAGTIGRSAPYTYNRECNANQAIAILDINQAEIDPEFLAKYLNSRIGQLFFRKIETISGQPNINFEQIKQLKVILPNTISQQKSLVSQTQVVEKEVAKLEIESNRLTKEATTTLVKELNFSVPNEPSQNYFFKSAEEKTVSFYMLPNEISDRMQIFFFHPKLAMLKSLQEKYHTIRLEEACSEPIHRGEQPKYDENGAVSVIKTVNVKDANIDYENCLKVSEDFFERFPSAHVEKNDVLVTSTGLISMGRVAVHTSDEPTVVDGHISIIHLKEEYDPFFVTYFLLSHLGQLQFEKWFSGSSGQIEIQPQDLNQFIIPSFEEKGIPTERQVKLATKITQKLENADKIQEAAKSKWKESKVLFEQLIYNQ